MYDTTDATPHAHMTLTAHAHALTMMMVGGAGRWIGDGQCVDEDEGDLWHARQRGLRHHRLPVLDRHIAPHDTLVDTHSTHHRTHDTQTHHGEGIAIERKINHQSTT